MFGAGLSVCSEAIPPSCGSSLFGPKPWAALLARPSSGGRSDQCRTNRTWTQASPLYLFLCGLAGSVDSQVLDLVSDQWGPRAQEPSTCCQEVQLPEGGRRGLSFLTVWAGLRAKQGKWGHLSCESALWGSGLLVTPVLLSLGPLWQEQQSAMDWPVPSTLESRWHWWSWGWPNV